MPLGSHRGIQRRFWEENLQGLKRLLSPRSIAVFGGAAAEKVIVESRKLGFTGPIWPVHPTRELAAGIPCFKKISDLPGVPDAAFVGVNRDVAIQIVNELSMNGCGGAIVHASGFGEVGEGGESYSAKLVSAAGTMPVVGPNCLGVINYIDKVVLWPDVHGGRPVDRGVALVTQSGAIAQNITMQTRGLPIAYVVNMGNQVVVDVADCIEAFVDDPRITVIAVYLEGLTDTIAFDRALRKAHEARKPVVILKSGKSIVGAQLARTHTAALAGADDVFDAYINSTSAVQVGSLVALVETSKLLDRIGPIKGDKLVALAYSGGEASLIADAAEAKGLRFEAFSDEETSRIKETVAELVTVSNPFDFHTFDWANGPRLQATFEAVSTAHFDMALLVLNMPRAGVCDESEWWIAIEAFASAMTSAGKPAAIVAQLSEGMPEAAALRAASLGLVTLLDFDHALVAIAAASNIGRSFDRPPRAPLARIARPTGPVGSLSEWSAKQVLAGAGISLPRGRLVNSSEAAIEAAQQIGFPIVAKAVGKAILHKTEMNAVKLGLKTENEVEAATQALLPLGEGVLIEEMIAEPMAEYILGIGTDIAFGSYLMVGSGGILTELIGDKSILLFPFSRAEARAAIERLRSYPLMDGFRGRPIGDVGALVEIMMKIQVLVQSGEPGIVELELNPVIVRAKGLGAYAVDAIATIAEASRPDARAERNGVVA